MNNHKKCQMRLGDYISMLKYYLHELSVSNELLLKLFTF